MDVFIISVVAFAAALLTFFSGFGLGTLLTPVMALFFPIDIAIGLTAIVHLLNNLFKLVLVGKHIETQVFLRFGIPAILAALVGAWLLVKLSALPVLYSYQLGGKQFEVTTVKLSIACLLCLFTCMDFVPGWSNLKFDRSKLALGGMLSGFFGGLSGHQGALRSAFLTKSGLGKEALIATGTAVSTCIDLSRLGMYARRFADFALADHLLLVCASISAFCGAFFGAKLLNRVTLVTVQRIVAVALIAISIALAAGWV